MSFDMLSKLGGLCDAIYINIAYDFKVLQKKLGHKNIQITLDTYASVFERFNKDENEKYDLYMKKIGI